MDATLRIAPDVAVIRSAETVPGIGFLPVRSFLLLGREPVLFDTGTGHESEAFVAALESLLDPRDLRWIVVSHADGDHAGALEAVLRRAPKARVVLNQVSTGKLSTTHAVPMPRVTWVNAGEGLDVGDRVLRFFRPPMYDCPSTVAVFDERTRLVFASDAFGAIVPEDVPTLDDAQEEASLEGMSWFCRANSPWLLDVRPDRYAEALRSVAALEPSWLLPSHLPAVPAAKVGRVAPFRAVRGIRPQPDTPRETPMTTTSPAARSVSARAFAGTVRRAAFAGAAAALLASGALSAAEPPKKPLTFGASPEVARGQYLVTILGCDDCHTPMKMGPKGPEPDMSRRLSGHPQALRLPKAPAPDPAGWIWAGNATNTAFAGPWGVSYAPNLTPDATGLGSWTEANFVKAIRDGKHLGVGRPIAPPMPWMAYSRATDDDLRAVYAYLKTVPPVKNQAPEYQAPAAARK